MHRPWITLISVFCATAAINSQASLAQERPNIVIILADDMGFSDIGCYGSEIATPNLDRLAKEGLRFTQFYNAARCCPTRAALLTGLYPHQAGVGHMLENWRPPSYSNGLIGPTMTIAELLRKGGYRTYHAGKWHVGGLGRNDARNHPMNRGFDRVYGSGGEGTTLPSARSTSIKSPCSRVRISTRRMPSATGRSVSSRSTAWSIRTGHSSSTCATRPRTSRCTPNRTISPNIAVNIAKAGTPFAGIATSA